MANLNMIKTTDKYVEYHYKITEFYAIINGVPSAIPVEKIGQLKIENYFEEASFPIFKVKMVLESSRYYEIMQNKDNIKFKIRIQSYYEDSGSTDGNKSLVRDIINDTFMIFPEEQADDFDREQKRQAGTLHDENQLEKNDSELELFLFKDTIVTKLRSSFNTILNKCTLTTAVTYLLYKAGVRKILMSPFDNTDVYDEIVIPPLTIEKQLKYLNNNYGFHKAGTLIYFGLIHSYVLNYKCISTAWENNEKKETNIYVLDKSTSDSYTSSAIIKPNEFKNYYVVPSDNIDITNLSIASNVLSGTDAQIINLNDGNTELSTSDVDVLEESNSAIIFNTSSNKYMGSVYTTQQKTSSLSIKVIVSDINIEEFNPNKTFSFIFESASFNDKYKGKYRIASSTYVFSGSGPEMTVDAILIFKKGE